MKPTIEKHFKGFTTFRKGIYYNYHPEIIKGERINRTLLAMYWKYQSNITTIIEEKLVYDSKDLLAWLGGALGIFVGYSFYDFAKQIIDVAFYAIYTKMGTR